MLYYLRIPLPDENKIISRYDDPVLEDVQKSKSTPMNEYSESKNIETIEQKGIV